ncbi:unnamed protein product [Nippostrongylus brasiliensis]|uniref:POP1 domain-containing protein n=1 Tax=Nippostrongylus brasiliensis TaxID=27835 RepID=A0A0N4YTX5_NIPBR|nr:unnamed protein product [Nippostrongylus brasiliensis]
MASAGSSLDVDELRRGLGQELREIYFHATGIEPTSSTAGSNAEDRKSLLKERLAKMKARQSSAKKEPVLRRKASPPDAYQRHAEVVCQFFRDRPRQHCKIARQQPLIVTILRENLSEERVHRMLDRNRDRGRSERFRLDHKTHVLHIMNTQNTQATSAVGSDKHEEAVPVSSTKTAVPDINSAMANVLAERAQNLQTAPGTIVIHEQSNDGLFKLELHLACRMNTTGRLNMSGCTPIGLKAKKVVVDGKDIWADC